MRYAIIVKPGPSPCPVIRIDTNQGVHGLGEVRDIAGYQYAMVLKSRILGENPLKVDFLFQKIAQFGGNARQGGGVSAVEMALWDIAGKVYTVRCTRCWAANGVTRFASMPIRQNRWIRRMYGVRAKERKAMGLTWMKMDLGINVLAGIPGTVMQPADQSRWELHEQPHPFMATEVTNKGIDRLCEYVAAVRMRLAMDMPLSMDHLGHIGVKSCIRLGQAYEKFNLEWIEDVIPWYYTDLLKQITDQSPTPTATGEDIYEIADFETLCKNHAVGKIHPDLATSGGILGHTRSATWHSAMACQWRCTLRARRSAVWRTSTARRQRATSWRSKTIRSMCPGGKTWSMSFRSLSSSRDSSRFQIPQV